VGRNGTVIATTDSGVTWVAQSSGTTQDLSFVQFALDGVHGWAAGGKDVIATVDGGKTWVIQPTGATHGINSVQFAADGQRGWAVGDGGIVIATADGGKTWVTQRRGRDQQVARPAVDPRQSELVGLAAMSVIPLGGDKILPLDTLYSVQFAADGQHGWAAGGSGVIATIDGGKTWFTQGNGALEELSSVRFATDGRRGWAVGRRGTVIATVDSGGTWVAQPSHTLEWLRSVQFLSDGVRGWAVGGGGTVITTVDGGRTWVDAWLPYRRLPALWFWVVALASCVVFARSIGGAQVR